jgi:hypothetical protein
MKKLWTSAAVRYSEVRVRDRGCLLARGERARGHDGNSLREAEMPTEVICGCRKNHKFKGKLRNAIIAELRGSLGSCAGGKPFRIVMHHYYPNSRRSDDLDVVKVVKIADPDSDRYEPYLLVLRRRSDGTTELWPIYWVRVRRQWKYGQYSPLVTPVGLKRALKEASRHN